MTPRSQRRRRAAWASQPSVHYRQNPWFYFQYDLGWMALFGGSIALLRGLGWDGLGLRWGWSLIPWLLAAIYLQIMAGVFIHGCSHANFPRTINRVLGECCGVVVATRFASWEILHRQHHKYSDQVGKDPHPVKPSFVRFVWEAMILGLEPNLHHQYLEHWGDTARHRRREKLRSVVSFSGMLLLMGFWYALLGPVGFLGVYLPSLLVGILHVSHFNWATHDAMNPSGDFKPVNLDHGFYKLGNKLWFGLYFHANHHRNPNAFDPRQLDAHLAERRGETAALPGSRVA